MIAGRRSGALAALLLFALLLTGCERSSIPHQDTRPSILLIVADDLGYTDLGVFGGEIHTPNLDRLALEGIRLSNFHASASCAPTRAMLLTGTDNHIAGMGSQSGLQTEQQAQHRAYTNALLPEVPTIAEHLADAGYATYIAAKWHLGREPESLPGRRGFDRSFVLLEGGGGHFDNAPLFERYGQATWLEDDTPVELPADFYSSDSLTDRLMSYIEASPEGPFFAYLGFTAPHWPLQAPRASLDRYASSYSDGWDALRAQRMAGAIAAGVVPADARAVDQEAGMKPWNSLSDEDRQSATARMRAYAAMVDRLDENVGRLLAFLEGSGKLDNTVIVFMSDNGAEGHDIETWANASGWVDRNFDNSTTNVGNANSYTALGPGWARATAAPFRGSKARVSEGGIRVPAFVHFPRNMPNNVARTTIDKTYMRVMDLAPTFLELAQAPAQPAMHGRSLLTRWTGGATPYTEADVIAFEVYGRRGAQRGHFKVLLQEPPFGSGDWELYNLRADPGEQEDLSEEHPELRAQLIAAWESYAAEVGVVLPEHPIAY